MKETYPAILTYKKCVNSALTCDCQCHLISPDLKLQITEKIKQEGGIEAMQREVASRTSEDWIKAWETVIVNAKKTGGTAFLGVETVEHIDMLMKLAEKIGIEGVKIIISAPKELEGYLLRIKKINKPTQ